MTYKTLLKKLRRQSSDALREMKRTEKTLRIDDSQFISENRFHIDAYKKSFEIWKKSHKQFLQVLDLLEKKKIKLDDSVRG